MIMLMSAWFHLTLQRLSCESGIGRTMCVSREKLRDLTHDSGVASTEILLKSMMISLVLFPKRKLLVPKLTKYSG